MIATATKSAMETQGIENANASASAGTATSEMRALAVIADGRRELRVRVMEREQRERQQREAEGAAEQDDRVAGDRARLDACRRPARPSRERRQREPEEQVDVGPQRAAVDAVDDLHQMVVLRSSRSR